MLQFFRISAIGEDLRRAGRKNTLRARLLAVKDLQREGKISNQ
jgi:hypothetical protein